jgi:hypothetical protein
LAAAAATTTTTITTTKSVFNLYFLLRGFPIRLTCRRHLPDEGIEQDE